MKRLLSLLLVLLLLLACLPLSAFAAGTVTLEAMAPCLGDTIGIYYYFSLSDDALTSGESLAFTVAGTTEITYPISGLTEEDSGLYSAFLPLSAKQMTDAITITLRDSNGITRRTYSVQNGKTVNYNLAYYASKLIELQSTGDEYNPDGFTEAQVTFVKNMLRYGAAAQTQFSYNTTDLATDYLPEADRTTAVATPDWDAVSPYKYQEGEAFTSVSLYGDADLTLWIYCTGSSCTLDGETAALQTDTAGNTYVELPISAKALSHVHTLRSGDTLLEFNTYSLLQSLYKDENCSEAQQATIAALFAFARSAEQVNDSAETLPTLQADAVTAVLNTAYAYLAKTNYCDYDQRDLCEDEVYDSDADKYAPCWRRQCDVSPEDATSLNEIFMDCSSFVYNVYRQALGTDAYITALTGVTEKKTNTYYLANVTGDAVVATYNSNALADGDTCVENMLSVLQPGDLIVVRGASSGHVVLWTGDGYIHCTGTSYDYEEEDDTNDSAPVKYVSGLSSDMWTGHNYTSSAKILRIIGTNGVASDSASDYGRARQAMGALSVSKTAKVGSQLLYDGQAVRVGDTVTYIITISNTQQTGGSAPAAAALTVNLQDTLPANTTLVSADTNPAQTGTTLCWDNLTIPAEETVTMTYSVKVNGEATVLQGTSGAVSLVGLAEYEIPFTFDDREIISSTLNWANWESWADSFVPSADTTAGTTVRTVNYALSALTGKTITIAESDTVLFSSMFKTSQKGYWYPDSGMSRTWLVSNFAAGHLVSCGNYNNADSDFSTMSRVRKITADNLMPGDVIVIFEKAEDNSVASCRAYILDQNKNAVTLAGAAPESTATLIESLFAQDAFAILRAK